MNNTSEKNELWDIYDADKKVTGRTMVRNDFHMKPGDYHLSVLAVIKRSDGRFLITKRVMTKRWAPGHWEVSGGGCIAGETSYEAVCRETLEETGLDVKDCPYKLALTYKRDNPDEGDNYFVDVYLFKKDFGDSDVKLQTEETSGYMAATLDEIKEIAGKGEFLHYNSIKTVFEEDI